MYMGKLFYEEGALYKRDQISDVVGKHRDMQKKSSEKQMMDMDFCLMNTKDINRVGGQLAGYGN